MASVHEKVLRGRQNIMSVYVFSLILLYFTITAHFTLLVDHLNTQYHKNKFGERGKGGVPRCYWLSIHDNPPFLFLIIYITKLKDYLCTTNVWAWLY